MTSGNCYRYRYTVSDNVGNSSSPSSASVTARVDTTAPGVSATAPTAVSGGANQYYVPEWLSDLHSLQGFFAATDRQAETLVTAELERTLEKGP